MGESGTKSIVQWLLSIFLLIGVIATIVLAVVILVKVNDNKTTNVVNPTDTSSTATTPTTATPLNINEKPRPTINPASDPEKAASYNQTAQYFARSINTSVDACEDFYAYACARYTDPISFYVVDQKNYMTMARQMQDPMYSQTNTPAPLTQTVSLFRQCQAALGNWQSIIGDGHVAIMALRQFQTAVSLPFPMLNQMAVADQWPDRMQLANALGVLSGQFGVDTLISYFIDTNWRDPHGSQPYALFVDQNALVYSKSYYQPNAWPNTETNYRNYITQLIMTLANVSNVQLDANTLANDVTGIINLELALARNLSTDDTTRRNYMRNYNMRTVDQLNSAYPFIDWRQYLQQLSVSAPKPVQTMMNSTGFQLLLMEVEQLTKLNDAWRDGNAYGITPRTVINYMSYRLIDAYSQYLPLPTAFRFADRDNKFHRPTIGRPQYIRRREPMDLSITRDDDIDSTCAEMTMGYLPYANARIFIDAIYPDKGANIRNKVGQVIENILMAFRSMVDQLAWMQTSTKQNAYDKINYLVKNIAFPDFVLNDTALVNYYAALTIVGSDSFVDMLDKIQRFNAFTQFGYLMQTSGTNRQDFNGPPGTVNAWYQPELNSITFPMAILQQPFFDEKWPASVNYGALGVVAGHELSHGFDDQGVQWDGTGLLQSWMDPISAQGFQSMAKCVIDEYSGFCPLNSSYSPRCINGEQTQGENIADNGGIHAAYRAYKTYIALNGLDPQLPDPLVGQFNHDQLFFLSFAQVWCSMPRSAAAIYRQLLVDPHSPYNYRVFGTIQNFPAFQTAFNCPVGSASAPSQHCDVWVSKTPAPASMPNTTTTTPALGIPTAPQVNGNNGNSATLDAYNRSVNYFKASINTSSDPCNDFYAYACSKFNHAGSSFGILNERNLEIQAERMKNPIYNAPTTPLPLNQTIWLFNACKQAHANYSAIQAGGRYALQALIDFQTVTGWPFPMLNQSQQAPATLTPTLVGDAMGYLAGHYGIDTLISHFVDTNWKDPTGPQPYKLIIDQNSLVYSKTRYQPGAWNITAPAYRNAIRQVAMHAATVFGMPALNSTQLDADIEAILNLELMLATKFSTDDDTRRQAERSYNPVRIDSNTLTYIDWSAYLRRIFADAPASVVNFPANYEIIVAELQQLTNLSMIFAPANAYNIQTRDIVNYFSFRLLLAKQSYLPATSDTVELPSAMRRPLLGRPNHIIRREDPVELFSIKNRRGAVNAIEAYDIQCTSVTMGQMQYTNARFFIDALYPDRGANIRKTAGDVIDNILVGFTTMIDQLPWMTRNSKDGAYGKINQLVKNIAFPDFVLNDVQLTAYYSNLNIMPSDDYMTMLDKLATFNRYLNYNYLTYTSVDRQDFLGPPGTVNAWYQPEVNSITFPAGILQPPFFDPLWPASVNYGALGLVAGHELTHGFDDQGVQWDGIGKLTSWLDANSTQGFQRMANCVINEYNNFCPLNGTDYSPQCINGAQTQGENIADNGGIHAAFRAYRNRVTLLGPDPQLPDPLMGQFNHDQLFFLSFAQVWCQSTPPDNAIYNQILNDPHSPAKYRVFGSIQNYAAFQLAFNCPLGTAYAPNQKCNVWVLDN